MRFAVRFLVMFCMVGIISVTVDSVAANEKFCISSKISQIVLRLGIENTPDQNFDIFRELMSCPQVAAGVLIRQLHPINVTEIKPVKFKNNKMNLHVIWSLRALRYITGGLQFTGNLGTEPIKATRLQFLRKGITAPGQGTYFGVWMSRNIIFIAPVSTQSEIIGQWTAWYKREGRIYDYYPAKSDLKWFFN